MIYGRITAEEALAQNLNWDSDLEEISSAEDLSETEDDITDPDFQFQHHSQDPQASLILSSCSHENIMFRSPN